MKGFRFLALAAVMALSMVANGFAHDASCVKRVDSFNFLVDQSGSMMMSYKDGKLSKMGVAKKAMERVAAALAPLDYSTGLYTFAGYGAVVPQGGDIPAFANGIKELKDEQPIFGRRTPMGDGIAAHGLVVSQMPKKAAVVFVSDGEANMGSDPVAEAKAVYDANPDVCFHVISVATSPEGKATLKKIAELSSCSVMVEAADLAENDAAVDTFVGDVFCMDGAKKPETLVLRGVNFAFDSAEITADSALVLDEAVAVLNEKQGVKLVLTGYTDSKGTAAYNFGLSKRRADAVKAYMVKKGVPASSLRTQGAGISYTYDNKTEEGRYMNRRCEVKPAN